MNNRPSVTNKRKSTYPQGLFTIAAANGCFTASLSMINALLVLYVTHQMNLPVKQAYNLYAAFGSLFFSSALLGGYLAGRYDYKIAVVMGGTLAAFGSFLLASAELHLIYFGLGCYIIGGGLMAPNLQCLLGKLFAKDDPMRDSGFTVGYIGMNAGGFISAFSSGFIATYFGFQTAFIISSSILIMGVVLVVVRFKHLAFKKPKQVLAYKPEVTLSNFIPMAATVAVAVPIVTVLVNHAKISNILLICIGIIIAFVVASIAMKEKGQARKKLFGFLIFTTFGIAFWALYMLAPSALTIFVKNNVNRHIGSFVIPTASVYALNPFFIIVLGTMTSMMFLRMSREGRTIPLRNKFAFGISSMGLGYIVLVTAVQFAGPEGYVALFWIVISYFLQTLGELFVGPIGFSMVGSLVPVRLEGLMMGVWQLSTGVAGAISGFLAGATAGAPAHVTSPEVTNATFAHFFGLYGSISLGVGIVIILLTPQFKKLWA